jgi:WD40 repeat protein
LLDYTADLEVYTTPGAEVALDRKPAGVADSSGRLLVRGVAASKYYRLHCARNGFNSAEHEFRLTAGILNTITLDLKPIEVQIERPASAPPSYHPERTLTLGTNSFGQLIDAHDVLFTTDGRVVGWTSKDLAVWQPDTGRQVRTVKIRPGLDVQALSRDIRWCAVREQVPGKQQQQESHLTLLVDIETGDVVQQHPGYYDMAFSPDSKRIVIRHPDSRAAHLYDINSGKALQTWKEYEIGDFSFSPDGRLLAATGEDGVTIRDTETGRTLQNWPATGVALRFSPDGRWLAVLGGGQFRLTTGDVGRIELWEARTGKQGRVIETSEVPKDGVFTSDSRRIITVTGQAIQTWNIGNGTKENDWPLKDAHRIVLSQDDAWMAVIGEHLTLWRRQ